MFVGYSLADINFRVLFRGLRGNLAASLKKLSVAVQLPYQDAHPNKQKAEEVSHGIFQEDGRDGIACLLGHRAELCSATLGALGKVQ